VVFYSPIFSVIETLVRDAAASCILDSAESDITFAEKKDKGAPFVPFVPLSHPFVERLLGTLRRECIDCTLLWTTTDLEVKLLDFQHY